MTTGHLRTALLAGCAAMTAHQAAGETLPKPPPPFTGKIDPSRHKAVPAWPGDITAPAGAPNVVLILLDDVGFGATSTNGGVIPTPSLDQVAQQGLRYNNFHVNALCSPTRAALLSGRNNHQLGFAAVTDFAVGYPGYNSVWPRSAASIAEVLKDNGYSTAAFGKWHNTPFWEVNAAGPFDRWPTGLGFEYFYGFMGGSTSQWEPALYRNTVAVEAPRTPDQGYILNADLADDAIKWLHQHEAIAPEKPFFLYFATGGTHAPHQVPREWIDRFRGQFDEGWDVLRSRIYAQEKSRGIIPQGAALTPRPAEIPAWDTLSPDAKKLMARQMEVYAGFLAHTDHEVGRMLQAVREEGRADNTLVLYIVGDNGAEEAAGLVGNDLPRGDGLADPVPEQSKREDVLGSKALNNNYATGWAYALSAPFPWSKQVASHLGGITDPLFAVWPSHIADRGGLRTQFSHITDIAPTIYQAAGITPPDEVNGVRQMPLEGKSLLRTFTDASARTGHTRQYFEMLGNRGIYQDGWFAGRRFLLPWESSRLQKWNGSDPNSLHPWELYNLNTDYSQAHDLAAQQPDKLNEMIALYDSEAQRNNAYPTAPLRQPLKSPATGKTSFTYRDGVVRLPLRSAPVLSGRSHRFTVDVDIPARGAQGVIFAEGGRYGGFSLYVKDGKLFYENNAQGRVHETIASPDALPSGHVRIVYDFTANGADDKSTTFGAGPRDGHGTLSVNGQKVGGRDITAFGGFPLGETFDVGRDLGSPASAAYETPFAFNGHIDKITLDLKK